MLLGDMIRFMNSDLEDIGYENKFPVLVPDSEEDFSDICRNCCYEVPCEQCIFGKYR